MTMNTTQKESKAVTVSGQETRELLRSQFSSINNGMLDVNDLKQVSRALQACQKVVGKYPLKSKAHIALCGRANSGVDLNGVCDTATSMRFFKDTDGKYCIEIL